MGGSGDAGKYGFALATGGISLVAEELIQKPQRQAEQLMKDQQNAQKKMAQDAANQAAVMKATEARDKSRGLQATTAYASGGRSSTIAASGMPGATKLGS